MQCTFPSIHSAKGHSQLAQVHQRLTANVRHGQLVQAPERPEDLARLKLARRQCLLL